jgi:hypothetical protein
MSVNSSSKLKNVFNAQKHCFRILFCDREAYLDRFKRSDRCIPTNEQALGQKFSNYNTVSRFLISMIDSPYTINIVPYSHIGGCHCPFCPCLFCIFLITDSGFRDKRDKILDKFGTNETKNQTSMNVEISYSTSKI